MAYLGQVDRKASNVQVFNVTSSTSATHSIGWTPPSEQTLIVTINGVKQHTNAYSFSGATLTLGAALVATDELEVIGINDIGNSLTPVDGSVSTSKLGDNAVTLAKMADGTQGDTLYYGAAGAPTLLAKPGTPADEVLTFATGATAPSWAAAAGGITASEIKGWRIRSIFTWASTTTIKLSGTFAYQHAGTTTQILTGSEVTFTRSDTSGTAQFNYLYIDDSAVVTAGNTTITASELISSPTAPTLNTTKGGFYNGNDRCIYAFKQDVSDNIDRFSISDMQRPGVVVLETTFVYESDSGAGYGLGWHQYTIAAANLPRPCGPSGLAVGLYTQLGGTHSTMHVGPDSHDWDEFSVGQPYNVNAPVNSSGQLNVRSDYAHSSYTHTFTAIGWAMSPLL